MHSKIKFINNHLCRIKKTTIIKYKHITFRKSYTFEKFKN